MRWEEDLKAKRTLFRGTEYDSVLETDWSATLTMWGIEFRYHPGRIFLSNNDIYEPDFQLDGDIIFEVKGEHEERLEKAYRASAETGIPLIVGRAPFIPAGSNTEVAGAVWEPGDWVVANSGSQLCFTQEWEDETAVFWSAPLAYARGLEGIRFFKAVGNDCV